MDLDRGTLARVDRKLLAGLGQDERFRMVRVPVTEAKWSTWKRYCDSAGISMGRAIMTLIDRELVSVFGDSSGDDSPSFGQQAEEELASREAEVVRRESELDVAEDRLRRWSDRLRRWEHELEVRDQRAELVSKLAAQHAVSRTKVGRNERCPCGSDPVSSTSNATACSGVARVAHSEARMTVKGFVGNCGVDASRRPGAARFRFPEWLGGHDREEPPTAVGARS